MELHKKPETTDPHPWIVATENRKKKKCSRWNILWILLFLGNMGFSSFCLLQLLKIRAEVQKIRNSDIRRGAQSLKLENFAGDLRNTATVATLENQFIEGDTGEPGKKGPRGLQGLKGEKGDSGKTGPPGSKGTTGKDGEKGEPGQQGSAGNKGEKGKRGPSGTNGKPGSNGNDGFSGPKGMKGDAGIMGDSGKTGAKGRNGIKGEKGSTGITGSKGEKGAGIDFAEIQSLAFSVDQIWIRLNKELRVRLGGVRANTSRGRVEILHNDVWGTICTNDWDMNDGSVICRMLGFSDVTSVYRSALIATENRTIWLDHVECLGNETNIEDCKSRDWGPHNCDNGGAASVVCRL